MSQEIVSPLASIVKRAMEMKTTGAVAAERERVEKRMKGASSEVLVVCDLSGSMNESIGGLNVTKYEHLSIALDDIRKHFPKVHVIVFGSFAEELRPGQKLPMPTGGTDLDGALTYARKWKPAKTIVISDGLPDDPVAAKDAADKLTGVVDTIYCGPDGHPACDYLRTLSHSTGGVSIAWDGFRTQLASNIRGLLSAG